MTDVRVEVDAGHTMRAVQHIIDRTSPSGITTWLESKMRPFLVTRIGNRFAHEGDEVVGNWAALMESTGNIRAQQGFAPFHPINVRTGQMRSHLMNDHSISGGDTLSIPGRSAGKVAQKIAMAQRGGSGRSRGRNARTGPNRPAPPRPVLGLGELDRAFAENSLQQWIESRA